MYESFFWLAERPFSIAPDPQYLYMSRRHKEAMAHLTYGVSQGSCFIVLTGEVGTGKTTLCRSLMEELDDNIDVALLLNPHIDENELLQNVCDELKIEYDKGLSNKELISRINSHLLKSFADNRRTVLIVDEAQELSRNVLEQIRLLTNLETNKAKLLQIILIGQPELNDLLLRNDLRQLAQRVTARYHLGPLYKNEIEEYVNFRLSVAGAKQPLFSRQAINKIYKLAGGIPRKVNVLADQSLLAAYTKEQRLVDVKTVQQAAREVFVSPSKSASLGMNYPAKALNEQAFFVKNRWWFLIGALFLLNLLAWGVLGNFSFTQSSRLSSNELIVDQRSNVSDQSLPVEVEAESETDKSFAEDLPETSLPTSTSEQIIAESLKPAEQLNGDTQSSEVELKVVDDPKPGSVVYQDLNVEEEQSVPQETQVLSAETPRSLSLDSILETSADQASRIKAFRVLSSLWQKEFPEVAIKPACELVNMQGLICKSFSKWEQLKRLNRPAIIVLADEYRQYRVVVRKIINGNAEILIGDRSYQVSETELKAKWNGRGVIFWQPRAYGAEFLQLNDSSDNLPALRKVIDRQLKNMGLAALDNLDSTQFDYDLSAKLKPLQVKYGVIADGKIGDETYLLLNEIEAPETTPVLMK